MSREPRLDALGAVCSEVGHWIPLKGLAVLSGRPVRLCRDNLGRLHSGDGMALAYPDGWGFHCWHGRQVPAWVIGANVDQIVAEPNVEIRRCAIEAMGWPRFTEEAGLVAVIPGLPAGMQGRTAELARARVADPGNPGAYLTLYDVPERLWGERVRLLSCTNGSVERDGTRRQYGLTVPAHISDPVEAAAWTAGLSRNEYARMVRRT